MAGVAPRDMYKAEDLIDDAAKKWGTITRRGNDLREVWDAINRYVTAVMQKKQTLNVSNFCKIGWKVEEPVMGKPRMRPYFHLADSFAKTHNLDVRSQVPVSDKYLALVEEFNYSKAALRFSQGLTKDAVFMGLRAITQQLGEALGSGQRVSVEFEVGTLIGVDKKVNFAFAAECYLQEGLEVPASATQAVAYRPSATFSKPSKDALTLSLQGSNQLATMVKATPLGGWNDSGPPIGSGTSTLLLPELLPGRPVTGATEMTGSAASLPSNSSRQDRVQQEALERHLAEVAAEAAAAIAENEEWEGHLKRCLDEEQKDAEWRRALAKDYASKLEDQMRATEQRRIEGRQHAIEQASLHDFPNFTETPELSVYEYIRERRNHLKQDLDQQVDVKRRLKLAAKQREWEQEVGHLEASIRELAAMRVEESAKREQDKTTLAQAWAKDKQLHHIKKAIEDYRKAPNRSDLSDLVPALGGSSANGARSMGVGAAGATAHGEAKQVAHAQGPQQVSQPLALPLGQLPSPGDGPASSRPPTGSVRRMPLGAAASLALHKERLLGRR